MNISNKLLNAVPILSVLFSFQVSFAQWSPAPGNGNNSNYTKLWGATVWEHFDGSILVQYQGQRRQYYPVDGNGSQPGPGTGLPNECFDSNAGFTLPIEGAPYLETQVLTVKDIPGGDVKIINLSNYYLVKQVQIRVLQGAARVLSAKSINEEGQSSSVNLVSGVLCENTGITGSINKTDQETLELRMDTFESGASIEVNIQYAKPECGGCDVNGCWIKGGGCNVNGCWVPGGGCNVNGCWKAGGGCNVNGCWKAGGSCNVNGCVKEVKDNYGEASSNPSCE